MMKKLHTIACGLPLFGLLLWPMSVRAQQEMPLEERIKVLDQLKVEDAKADSAAMGLTLQKTATQLEKLELPRSPYSWMP